MVRATAGSICFVLGLACGPTDSGAPATEPAASSPAPAPVPSIQIGAKRETRAAETYYPVPVEVGACLDLVEAGDLERAASICAEARRLAPGNAQVRAALSKLPSD